MKIAELSIRRPVLATVMNLLLILVGIIAYQTLPVREYPNIDVPVVSVETAYAGANASIIETQVTQILEDSLSGIEGIDYMAGSLPGPYRLCCLLRDRRSTGCPVGSALLPGR